jgi:hypothetical protein
MPCHQNQAKIHFSDPAITCTVPLGCFRPTFPTATRPPVATKRPKYTFSLQMLSSHQNHAEIHFSGSAIRCTVPLGCFWPKPAIFRMTNQPSVAQKRPQICYVGYKCCRVIKTMCQSTFLALSSRAHCI